MSHDYTAFDIMFDPLVQRMTGHTVHGNHEFSVPFMSEIADNLWMGGCQGGLVLPKNIKHVVSLYRWEQYEVEHELDSDVTVKQYDDPNDALDHERIVLLARWVNVCRK